MFTDKTCLDLLNSNTYEKYNIEFEGNRYLYNGYKVPRVTEILSSMLHEDFLMTWSNNIGLYNHQKYAEVLQEAADKGSFVHDSIEKFLKFSIEPDFNSVPESYRNQVYNAFNSFKYWWDIIKKNSYNILMQEEKLICPWFGGTLDMLIEINGKVYLVDFKTSNHPSYKYFLQLSAYRYMLFTEKGIAIDGVIILMLNKKSIGINELLLDFSNQEHLCFINCCQEAFMSLVYAYYNRLYIQNQYGIIFNGRV